MSYLNQVSLLGNLGKHPEVLKTTETGSFVRLQLATSKKYINAKGETVKVTQWHNVYLNNGSGKYAASFFEKGDKILICGELRNDKWKDKEGETHYSTAVHANECKLISKPQKKEEAPETSEMHVNCEEF